MRPCRVLLKCLPFVFFPGMSPAAALAEGRDTGHKKAPAAAEGLPSEILDTLGIHGGLIVHIGCDGGRLTAALRPNEKYLVHGLSRNRAAVQRVRGYLQESRLYGQVSVEHWAEDHLPYADNLVNLIVAEDPGDIPKQELLRVLAPNGVLYLKNNERWEKTVNPWPATIDEWTHYLHDSSNNPVAHDTEVGPPRHLRWRAGPIWARSHSSTTSVSALVSAAGRLFYINDDAPRAVAGQKFPGVWNLVARDAFSGVLLWKRPMPDWGAQRWKSWRHWSTPMSLPRRLVAAGDQVFVTLGYRTSVTALDARTGETLRVFADTDFTEEILWSEGVLIVRRRKEIPNYHPGMKSAWNVLMWKEGPKSNTELPPASTGDEEILAFDAQTGEVLWTQPERRIVTLSMASEAARLCYHNFEEIVCLDLRSGKQFWRAESKPWPDIIGTAGTLVMHDGTVLLTSSEGMVARSAATGAELWRGPRVSRMASRHPADLIIANGLIWGGLTAQMPYGHLWPAQVTSPGVSELSGVNAEGLDPATGTVKRSIDIRTLISSGHHVRCYRSKATDRYLLWPKRGVEFVDIQHGRDHARCDWARGECSYGLMPCNGLLYAPPHPCVCYGGVLINGFNALAASQEKERAAPAGDALQRGPAYGKTVRQATETALCEAWPTYRHDIARSGSTTSQVPVKLKKCWSADIGGKLSSSVIAAGRVFVSAVDAHTIHCLDTGDGKELWSYTTSGRVDTPPTVSGDLVVFGCRDGCVYCLRAADGELVWRFRAAPEDRRIVAHEQVESAWPVSGSVLHKDGAVYFAAGRSSFLDGGIHLFGLDASTGTIVHKAHLDGPQPDIDRGEGHPYTMEGAKADVLVAGSKGKFLYMLQSTLDWNLKLQPPVQEGARREEQHLAPLSGFLDDSWFHRTQWRYCRAWPHWRFYGTWPARVLESGKAPKTGQILVFDDSMTYAVRRRRPYVLYADSNDNEPILEKRLRPEKAPLWSVKIDVRPLAMVQAAKTLFIAGPPDTFPEKDPYAAFEGRRGGALLAFSTKGGKKLAEYELGDAPVFDGMAAGEEKLFISTQGGKLLCFEGEEGIQKHELAER